VKDIPIRLLAVMALLLAGAFIALAILAHNSTLRYLSIVVAVLSILTVVGTYYDRKKRSSRNI
jgi:hypothetical protein